MRALLTILAFSVLLSGTDVSAQGISIFQGSDGTSGTIVDLGGGIRSYSDSHGTTGTILDLGGGIQSYQFSSPHGGPQSGTILTFPAPRSDVGAPPVGLTPAPVLPFLPNRPLMPREQLAPLAPPAPGMGTFNTFGGGGGVSRFGR
jgi:hypothetical protein